MHRQATGLEQTQTKKKVEPIPLEDFYRRKTEITRKQIKRQSIAEYDPRPTSVQTNNAALLENLRVSLLQSNYTSAFLQLLVAPEHVALHDHTYCSHNTSTLQLTSSQSDLSQENNLSEIQDILESVSASVFQKNSLVVTLDEREQIEVATREQTQSHLWYIVRARRITGSTSGKILCQHDMTTALLKSVYDMTTALLKSVLYPKPFGHLPASIKWGVDNEPKANEAYIKYAKAHGKTRLATSKCGFIIYPTLDGLELPRCPS